MARIVNHTFKKSGAWFGEKGKMVYELHTVNTRQYDYSQLTVRDGKAEVVEEPSRGATGQLRCVVNWSYGWFGKVEYNFQSFDQAVPGGAPANALQQNSRLMQHNGARFGDSGTDMVRFVIPIGFNIASVDIRVLTGKAVVSNAQQVIGAGGTVDVTVDWSYGWFGSANYFVSVQLVAIGLAASVSPLALVPNPAVAGSAISGTTRVTNEGSVTINILEVRVIVRALTLEDVPQIILDGISEENRVQEVFYDLFQLNLAPGQSMEETIGLGIPATIPAPGDPSSAGTYRVTLTVLSNSVELAQTALEPLTIQKQSLNKK